MKNKLGLRDWIEITGAAGIILSLIFVGLQLQQDRRLFTAGIAVDRVEPTIELNNAIVENPGIWARGNLGEQLNTEEFVVYERLLNSYNEITFSNFASAWLRGDQYVASLQLAAFSAFLATNPGAYTTWNNRELFLEDYRGFLIGEQSTSTMGSRYRVLIRDNVQRLNDRQE